MAEAANRDNFHFRVRQIARFGIAFASALNPLRSSSWLLSPKSTHSVQIGTAAGPLQPVPRVCNTKTQLAPSVAFRSKAMAQAKWTAISKVRTILAVRTRQQRQPRLPGTRFQIVRGRNLADELTPQIKNSPRHSIKRAFVRVEFNANSTDETVRLATEECREFAAAGGTRKSRRAPQS
jgi:hypothetical protein